MKEFLLHWIFAFTVCLSVIIPHRISAQNAPNFSSMHIGFNAGYSLLHGHYSEELQDGPFFSINATSPFVRFLEGYFSLAFASHELSGSNGSQLYSLSLNLGPLAKAQLAPHFAIYASPLARFEYLYLKARKLDREENTIKPGFGAETGMLCHITPAINLKAGISFSQIWLSGTPYRSFVFYGSAEYNVFHIVTEDKIRAERAEENLEKIAQAEASFTEGMAKYEKGELYAAKKLFTDAVRLKNTHSEAQAYLDRIDAIEKDYRLGIALLEKKDYFAAILPLERSAKSMKEAKEKLEKTRSALRGQIPDLTRGGIRAYESNDFATCIALMTKITLIDPKNKTAAIYLPRAKHRLEAMKKLK